MNIQQIRAVLKERYSGPTWSAKVDKMSDQQVFAVYTRPANQPKKSW